MMRVVSRWNQWEKCHSENWVNQNWRHQCVVNREKPGVDSRDEGKHTGRNDVLFVQKMWMDDPV